MTPDERNWVEQLLSEIPPPSCRAVSRTTGISDWTIRRIKRELDGDQRPMRRRRSSSYDMPGETESVSPAASWLVFGGFLAVLAFAIWAGLRWTPPLDSTDFPHGFYPNSPTERTDNETEFPE